ncbi:hypothetical protein CERSUDRAFT_96032 [Gelatoporia subvermispora B]|uniref:NACHT domain-containing protein n=1 Tax=Ceriporiopsis subvermispora (strain B) TaxID=914234 RepID=M2RBM1_CERS8|nr:hypothetical protein CERSUDRAFT_96032 [Gelatoporia subvermispora B]
MPHFLDKYKISKPSEEQIDKAIDTTLVYIDKGLGVLSTVSSFAPVAGVSTAIPILQSIVETVQDVRRNDKARLEVMKNISGLVDLVQSTTLQVKQKLEPVEPSSRPVPTEFGICIDQLVKDLTEIKRKGKELPGRHFFGRIIHKDEIESILDGMNKSIADTSDRLRMKQELIVGLLVEDIHEMVRKMKRSQSRQEIERVLERLPHVEASLRNGDSGDFVEGTRVNLLKRLHAWASNTDVKGSSRIFVLSGAAGTGKSTLARALARQLHEHKLLGALFGFVRSTAGDLGTTRMVLPTIAYQLADMHDSLKGRIAEAAKEFLKDHVGHHLREQMEKLIISPLKDIPAHHPPIVLILDALDECIREDIISLLPLLRRLDEIAFPLRMIITTRPEEFITDGLKTAALGTSMERFDLKDISDQEVDDDIRRFFAYHFNLLPFGGRLLTVRPGAIEALIARAERLFIYAKTVMQALQNVRTFEVVLRRLDSILGGEINTSGISTLDALYLTVLDNAYTESDMEDPNVSRRVRAVLASIVVLQDRFSLDVLTHLFNIPEANAIDTLRELQSVIYFDESGPYAGKIRPLHLTFREFISDNKRCKNNSFFVDARLHHRDVALACLQIVNGSVHTNMCDLPDSALFKDDIPDLQSCVHVNIAQHVQYACKYWAIHLSNADASKEVLGTLHTFCEDKLLVWLEALSLMNSLDMAVQAFTISRAWCREHTLDDILQESSNLLYDGYRLLLEFFEPISQREVMVAFCDFEENESARWTVYIWEASGEMRVSTVSDITPNAIPMTGMLEKKDTESSNTHVLQCKLVKKMPDPSGWSHGVVFSPDGSRFVNFSDCVAVYDICADASELVPVTVNVRQLADAAAFSPGGNLVACKGTEWSISLWDAHSGDSVSRYLGHTSYVRSLCFSPNGELLASGSSDGTVQVWDTSIRNSDASDPPVAHGHARAVDFVQISPNGRYAASSSSYETHLVVWNTTDATIVHTLPAEESKQYHFFRSAAFSLDSTLLLCAGAGPRCARIWNIESGNLEATFEYVGDEEKGASLHLGAFSSTGAYIAVGRIYYPDSESGGDLHCVDIWDVAEGAIISTHRISRSKELCRPLSLTFSHDDNSVALASFKDNISCVLDIRSGEESWEAVVPSQSVFELKDGWITPAGSTTKLCWIPSNRRAYCGGESWGNLMPAFASQGSLVALGSGNGEVTFLDLSHILAPQRTSTRAVVSLAEEVVEFLDCVQSFSVSWLAPQAVEFTASVQTYKKPPLRAPSQSLFNKFVALLFSKHSARAHFGTEIATILLGGRALFMSRGPTHQATCCTLDLGDTKRSSIRLAYSCSPLDCE